MFQKFMGNVNGMMIITLGMLAWILEYAVEIVVTLILNFYDWVKPNHVKPGNQCSKPIDKSNITTIDGWID